MDSVNKMSSKGKLLLVVVVGLVVLGAILASGLAAGGAVFIAVTLVGIFLLLSLTFIVANSSTASLNHIAQTAHDISNGNLNINFKNNLEGDLGVIENSLAKLTNTLASLTDSVSTISHHGEIGELDMYLKESSYQGAFHDMAVKLNGLLSAFSNETSQTLSCLESIERGDFSTTIRPFPGNRGQISTILSTLGPNIKNLNNDLKGLIESAASGQLNSRIDVSAHKGNWGEIARHLNSMMDTIAAPINEAVQVMDKVSKGNFSEEIKGEYKGDFGRITTSINDTISHSSRSVKEITRVLGELSKKNLKVDVQGDFIGDFSAIKNELEKITSQFNDVLANINFAANHVAVSAKTISESSISVAEGATVQASTVDELTLTINQVDEKTTISAENAIRAEALSKESKESAVKGNAEMQNMLVAMDGIKESSSNISRIIQVIGDIAFQTSLLALNASVEAARAGVYGKGFSVVAEEVRKLADRSDEAAKETTALIEESIEKVNQGTAIATATANSLELIVRDTDEVAAIISGISKEFNQQSESISQVNTGTGQIAEVIQRNSSTAQETAAAAQELSSQSEILKDLISVFNLRNSGSSASTSTIKAVSTSQNLMPKPSATLKPVPVKPTTATVAPTPVASKPTSVASKPSPVKPTTATVAPTSVASKPNPAKATTTSEMKSDAKTNDTLKATSVTPISQLKPDPTPTPKTSTVTKSTPKTNPTPTTTTPITKPASPVKTEPLTKPTTKIEKLDPEIEEIAARSGNMAAAYMAESQRMINQSAKTKKPATTPLPLPEIGPPSVKTPSGSHVYDKSDYGKY